MKEWIGYYKDVIPNKLSDDIMSIKGNWKKSNFENYDGTLKDSSHRVTMDEFNIRDKMIYYKDLLDVTKNVIKLYKNKHPYMKYFAPNKASDFRVNRYSKGGFMNEHTDNIHHSHGQQYGFPQGSILYFLNDDYKGGELIMCDMVYKPKKNSAIIFPSNFMFPHSVNRVLEGTRYSIIAWLM